jgi:hypothetical protein
MPGQAERAILTDAGQTSHHTLLPGWYLSEITITCRSLWEMDAVDLEDEVDIVDDGDWETWRLRD